MLKTRNDRIEFYYEANKKLMKFIERKPNNATRQFNETI